MAISAGALKRNVRALSIAVGDDSVRVEYRPGAITQTLVDEIAKAEEQRPLMTFLVAVLAQWDVLDDDGQALPINEVVLADLPLEFLRLVRDAILEDLNVPKAKSAS